MRKIKIRVEKGGQGSGFYDHPGRPGKVGGSSSVGGRVIKTSIDDVHAGLRHFVKSNIDEGYLGSRTRSGNTMYGIYVDFGNTVDEKYMVRLVQEYLDLEAPGWGIHTMTLNDITAKFESVNTIYVTTKGRISGDMKIVRMK